MASPPPPTLREKQAAATREHILEAAYDLLIHNVDQPFSHEAIAAKAGVGARTVYRYFPAQADLFEELWVRVRREAGTTFPAREEDILPQVGVLFEGFNRNEELVNAVLASTAGHNVRQRGAPEGRASFSKSLAALTAGMSPVERRRVMAVFLAIYSAPFWQLLRERGGLSEQDSIPAAEWALGALMRDLRGRGKTKRSNQL
jgi:AcrR family transcriptional regulator